MNKALDWLLDESEPAARYRTLTWLLGRKETDKEIKKARERVKEDPSVQRIFAMQDEDGGFYGKGSLDPMVPLSDFGLPESDPGIQGAIELIYSRQTEDGGFKHYYGKKLPCTSAYSTGLLLALGEGKTERTQTAVRHLLSIQRKDGGWLHGLNTLPGGTKENLASCPHATLHALWAMSMDDELRGSRAANRALEFVLHHWETKLPIPDQPGMGFGIGSRFANLKYPLLGYHILAYASILAHYHRACKDKRLKDVSRTILAKRGNDGLFKAESFIKAFSDFEFGRKNQPSKWITLHALTVIKNVLGEEYL